MGVEVEVSFTNRVPEVTVEMLQRLPGALDVGAERLLARSVERSPWDEGTLANAHSVERATSPDEGAAVVADTPYAARLHEHPEYNFATDANPNAQGKWVENAALEHKDEIGEVIAAELRRST